MYGKAITHIIRVAAVLQALENAFDIVRSLNTSKKFMLSEDLKTLIMDDIDQRARLYEIKYNTLCSAKKLVEYFILNRLTLAGYGCKLTFKCNFENIQLIILNLKPKASVFINETQRKIAREIFLTAGHEVKCNDLVQRKKGTADEIVAVFNILETSGLGVFTNIESNRGPVKKIFKKINVQHNTDLIFFMENEIGLDMDSFVRQYNADSPNKSKKKN
jgi:hypothetical protein